ncbi:DUF721 domain-containing protein [Halocynthiibacter namhaensis]|uniref:DUF721 domain-containing protein n=1 Tax=Halocynthiibacter namhaensis TaxID=1290553 RepID=UPI0005798F14|nr:DciA family protein [Halocynthiibacter namhaensis]
MEKHTYKKTAPYRRRGRKFTRTGSLLEKQIRKVGESRGFSVSRLLTHWAEIVGEETAATALPVKVGYGRGGMGATLTVLTTGANAPLLQMQAEKIREKVNGCYGYAAISKVKITQTAATGFAEGKVQFKPKPRKQPEKIVTEEMKHNARDVVAGVENQTLHDALALLGENILSKQKS